MSQSLSLKKGGIQNNYSMKNKIILHVTLLDNDNKIIIQDQICIVFFKIEAITKKCNVVVVDRKGILLQYFIVGKKTIKQM